MVPIEQPTTPIPSVLFVCTANQIRSPMAAAMLKKKLVEIEADWSNWHIESAGTWGDEGRPLNPLAAVVLKEFGIQPESHRSQMVNRSLVSRFHLILTMESGQKEALRVEFPEMAGRVMLLSEMTGQIKNVPDPVGGKLPDYHQTGKLIQNFLDAGFERIKLLARR